MSPVSKSDVQFIVNHYAPRLRTRLAELDPGHNQICGGWVEVLPPIFMRGEQERFLTSAISAFAAALRHHHTESEALRIRALETYGESLELVNVAVRKARGVLRLEHSVAIMCLAITEV